MSDEDADFLIAPVSWHDTPTARIAHRTFGEGPPLVMLHGWPLWGFTFRKVLKYLAGQFTCHVLDLPGGGDTEWTSDTDFTWPGQAASVKSLLEGIGLEGYYLLGQDSGAMIARHLCLIDRRRVRKLVMTNTEIPNHRPPYLPTYRRLMALPGAGLSFRLILRWRWFVRSRFGFGGSLDPANIDGEFYNHIIRPLIRSGRRMAGHIRFLRGWSWAVLDRRERFHGRLGMPVLLVWGTADRTFPIDRARDMAGQFDPPAVVKEITGARLFVQEDAPEELADAVIGFLHEGAQ